MDYSTEALRIVFKQEWNYLYPATPWRDDHTSGAQILAVERRALGSRLYNPAYSAEYQPIRDHLSSGDVEEWDVTTLVFALKFSHALASSRSSHYGRRIGNAIYRLKEVRNEVIAHASKAYLSRRRFHRNIDILTRAVGDLLRTSHPLVRKLQTLETEIEFRTKDLERYKQWLKDDNNSLLSLEKDLERLENKMKIQPVGGNDHTPSNAAGSSRASENSEIISKIQTRVARIQRHVNVSVDLVPSRTKPEIFQSSRYIKMINKTNSLSFNLRWDELETFLKGFTSDLDLKILAGIQHAAALSHRSRKDEALEVLNGLVPNALLANNGVWIHARIKIRKSYLLHDKGQDDDALREVDEAEHMLSLGECHEDTAEVNNAKANIILSSSRNSKEDQQNILLHLDKSIKYCEKATVDKSNTVVQVTLRKALVHLGFYQHGILEEVSSSDIDIAKTVLNNIERQIETMSERSKIYYTYSQSLLAYREGDIGRATKLEHKARKKCVEHDLTNEIQQLDRLRDLIRAPSRGEH